MPAALRICSHAERNVGIVGRISEAEGGTMRRIGRNSAILMGAVLLAFSGVSAHAQSPAEELTQLKSSLAAAQDELRRNRQEMDDLRQRLQQIEERVGAAKPDKEPTYPTAAIVQQEPQGVPAQPQNEDTQLL